MSINSVITITGTEEYTTKDQSDIKLNKTLAKAGSQLTRSGNTVVVGDGVTKVLISASVFINSTTPTSYGWAVIKKNNEITGMTAIGSMSGNFMSSSITPALIEVSKGDVIKVEFTNAPSGGLIKIRGFNSWLTVQAIA